MLLVGLGNPGLKYCFTRHNAGFLFLDKLADFLEIKNWQDKFNGSVTATAHEKYGKIILLKPQTTMNLSGNSVSACMNFFKITPKDMIVIHDDLELGTGIAKLKFGGSHGGHNGVRNISESIGDNTYLRLRIGIDRPSNKNYVKDYVLSDFPDDEMEKMQNTFDNLISNIDLLFAEKPSLKNLV